MEHVIDCDASIAFISETWMEADKNDITAIIKSYGYTLIHNRRKGREKIMGGGVGIMIKLSIIHKHLKSKMFSSFEQTMVMIKLTNNTKLILITIYRLLFASAVIVCSLWSCANTIVFSTNDLHMTTVNRLYNKI